MTAIHARQETTSLVTALLDANLVIDTNAVVIRHDGQTQLVTWSSHPTREQLVVPGEFGTLLEYRRMLRNRQYTCLLAEGSLLQLSFVYRHDELIKHRFSFHPCPVLLQPEDLELADDVESVINYYLENEFTDVSAVGALTAEGEGVNVQQLATVAPEEVALAEVASKARVRLRSPIRFDFDREGQGPGHPASHIHLTHEECRWPVFGPISLGHFIRFIFRHFYPEVAAREEHLLEWPLRFGNRSITQHEEGELFIDCRQG